LGLIQIVIGSVSVVQLGLKQVLGVNHYPYFEVPSPAFERFPGEKDIVEEDLTESQKENLATWENEYDAWKEEESFVLVAAKPGVSVDTASAMDCNTLVAPLGLRDY
jgi:hypothetical protein